MKPYYEDESVTLYGGDSLAVLRDLPAASVDALITDPPYSSGGMVRGDRAVGTAGKYLPSYAPTQGVEFTGDSRDQRAYGYWASLWLSEALRASRPGALAMLFTDWRQLPTTTDALQSGGWVWRGIIPWSKPASRVFAGRFTTSCEYVVWGSNGALPNPLDGGSGFPGFYQTNPPRNKEHQTQKPLDVMRGLLAPIPEGGTVLDPFMGSGTTGVAAMLEGRRFVGVEMVPHYQQVAERRIREAQGQAIPKGEQDAFDFGDAL